MRIKIQQFLFGVSHSWSLVGQNIGRALIKLGHEIEFVSTDGFEEKYCPYDIKPFVKEKPTGKYDCQISYTAPHNWPNYLQHGDKNRFAIWNYEYNNKQQSPSMLLKGFAKFYKAADAILPSSNFSKDVFISMGIPDEKMIVIPHGINLEDYSSDVKTELNTKKKIKILLNIAQPHRRKAIHLALEAFGKAFKKGDDVCLVAKVLKVNSKGSSFDIDFDSLFLDFRKKFPNHAEVELIHKFIPNIAELYKSCNVNFSATHAECWHLPSLEAIASGIINVVPRYGGILDFCNDENSLLIDGKIARASREHQYWEFNPFAVHFVIDTDDAANKLQKAVNENSSLLTKLRSSMSETASKFTWTNVGEKILSLCV